MKTELLYSVFGNVVAKYCKHLDPLLYVLYLPVHNLCKYVFT